MFPVTGDGDPRSHDPLIVDVRDFWFGEPLAGGGYAHQDRWFRRDPQFDAACAARFAAACARAAAGTLEHLLATPDGSLTLVLLLDQFPRNIHRGRPEAFSADARARAAARQAIARGFDRDFPKLQRQFFYLPFEHSESIEDQNLAVSLIGALEDDDLLYWSNRHRAIIERFGRFPHRNAILGRSNTREEEAFLREPGSSF
jgi:uncharacterized protein (DUF924 family)